MALGTRGIRRNEGRARAALAALSLVSLLAGSGCASSARQPPMAELDARVYGAPDLDEALWLADPETRRTRAIRAVVRARQAEKQGDPAEAFRQYQRAYALTPDDDEADRYAGELARLSTALPGVPELPEGARRLFDRAQEQARNEQYAEAEVSLRKVTRAAPWSPQAHFELALILARQGRHDAAALQMERYLRLAPASEQAEEARDQLFRWKGQLPAATP